jgi:hypothetical protein
MTTVFPRKGGDVEKSISIYIYRVKTKTKQIKMRRFGKYYDDHDDRINLKVIG